MRPGWLRVWFRWSSQRCRLWRSLAFWSRNEETSLSSFFGMQRRLWRLSSWSKSRWNCFISLGHFRFLLGSQVLSDSGKPFHFTRYNSSSWNTHNNVSFGGQIVVQPKLHLFCYHAYQGQQMFSISTQQTHNIYIMSKSLEAPLIFLFHFSPNQPEFFVIFFKVLLSSSSPVFWRCLSFCGHGWLFIHFQSLYPNIPFRGTLLQKGIFHFLSWFYGKIPKVTQFDRH